jgi:hypothetical protein
VLDAGGARRFFMLNSGCTLVLRALSMRNGKASGSGDDRHGGAIYAKSGSTLDARDVEFKDNSASGGVRPRSAAPPCHPAARARARRRRRSQRALTPTRRTRLRTHAIQGGVSLINGGTATFTSCDFTSNSAKYVRLRSPPRRPRSHAQPPQLPLTPPHLLPAPAAPAHECSQPRAPC